MQKIKMNPQDPLMRRIDGSHMIPPSAVIPNLTYSGYLGKAILTIGLGLR